MNWVSHTAAASCPSLANLTPMAAHVLVVALCKQLAPDTPLAQLSPSSLLNPIEGTGRPLEMLLMTIRTFDKASNGGDLGNFATHDRRLADAWKTIENAISSENEADRIIAAALKKTIVETLPYTHVVQSNQR